MGNQKSYFAIGNRLFWGLIVLVILFAVLKLNPGIFKGDKIVRDIIVQDSLSKINWDEFVSKDSLNLDSDELVSKDSLSLDSLKVPKDEYLERVWKWRSFDGKDYVLNFRIRQLDYAKASRLRESSDPGTEIWVKMYENDKSGLKEMVNQYRDIIIKNRLSGMEALNMVVSSVQSIPYVLISPNDCPKESFGMEYTNDCRPRNNSPGGCCGNILPWGVYSPIEYAVNGSGDCDTKSLFACVILKELNLGFYDVAMLTGDVDAGPHAMLGVNIINPPYNDIYVNDFTRSKYYAWETTSEGNELGQNVWKTWNNWVVVNL